MANSRLLYAVKWKVDSVNYLGWMHCKRTVAEFLNIEDKGLILSDALALVKSSVEAFDRTYIDKDGTEATTTVGSFERAYALPRMIGGKKIIFQTGKPIGKSFRTLSFRANPGMPNLPLIDALGEIIPEGKVKRGGEKPGAAEIASVFIIGNSRYVLKKQADATATPAGDGTADVPDDSATLVTMIGEQRGKPRP